jgi:hypothetical protein
MLKHDKIESGLPGVAIRVIEENLVDGCVCQAWVHWQASLEVLFPPTAHRAAHVYVSY